MNRFRKVISEMMVPMIFGIITVAAIWIADLEVNAISSDVLERVFRNMIIVISLMIPIVAGLGLNFGIVLGAMAGQVGLMVVENREIPGLGAVFVAVACSIPIAMLLGYLTGLLFNRARGKEMIAGLILGFFANGIYQLLFLILAGPVIPLHHPDLLLPQKMGLRVTVNLVSVERGLDAPLEGLEATSPPAWSVAYGADGRLAVSAGPDGKVRIWDLDAGRQVRELSGHHDAVWSVAFDPGGKRVASGGDDGTVRIWDVATGEAIRTLAGHRGAVLSVAFDPSGRWFASGGADGTIRIRDAARWKAVSTIPGHRGSALSIAFAPDGETIASGGADGTIGIWDARSGGGLLAMAAAPGAIFSVAFGPDGRTIASGGADGTIRIRDVRTWREIRALSGHAGSVFSVAFDRQGKRLASAGRDGGIRLWDAAAGREERTLEGHEGPVLSVAFGPGGETLLTGGADETVRLWRLADGREMGVLTSHSAVRGLAASIFGDEFAGTIPLRFGGWRWRELEPPSKSFTSVAFHPDGTRIATGDAAGSVALWQVEEGAPSGTFGGHSGAVNSVAFDSGGSLLASGGADGRIVVREGATGEEVWAIAAHVGAVESVAFEPGGSLLASGGAGGGIGLWDAATGRRVRSLAGHEGAVRVVVFAPDGRTLASGGADGTARLWDVAEGRELAVLPCGPGEVNALAFRPDGSLLVSGGGDGTARIWDVAALREVGRIEAHDGGVLSVAYGPFGRRLATAGADGTVAFWDAATWRVREERRLDEVGGAESLAFGPDGKTLAAAGREGGVGLIEVGGGKWWGEIPLPTLVLIVIVCVVLRLFFRTKMGQDIRAVGQDRHVAEIAGIRVNRCRIIAIVLSMVCAGIGQIVWLQNMAVMNTYQSHEQVGFYAIAAILVGGATVTRVRIWNAIVGTVLFHTLIVVVATAGMRVKIPQIGEYFRQFFLYAIIGVTLAIYAWKARRAD